MDQNAAGTTGKSSHDRTRADQSLPEAISYSDLVAYEAPPDERLPEALYSDTTTSVAMRYEPLPADAFRKDPGAEFQADEPGKKRRIFHKFSRCTCGVLLVLIVAIVITAVVLGIVFAKTRDPNESHDSSSNSSTTAVISGVPGMHPKSRLAAFNYTVDDVDFRHVYFQNKTGGLMEGTWASNTTTWTVHPIWDTMSIDTGAVGNGPSQASDVQPKIGTPIAASGTTENYIVSHAL
jgi:hypothetical protein